MTRLRPEGSRLPDTADPAPPTTPGTPQELQISTVGHVRLLVLNRPGRLHALSRPLWDALIDAYLEAGADAEVRAIVITATGDKAFCSGFDLKDVQERDNAGKPFRGPMDQDKRLLFEVVHETWKPTIAAVNGAAIGAGFELALACDLRIASAHARFALPEARIGMGGIYGSVVLPRTIPVGIALEMMYTGDYMSMDEARRWGLVNNVVDSKDLFDTAMGMAERIAANAPITVRRMKEMALKGLSLPVATALRLNVGPDPYTAQDRKEGIAAFLEKRKPVWKGR